VLLKKSVRRRACLDGKSASALERGSGDFCLSGAAAGAAGGVSAGVAEAMAMGAGGAELIGVAGGVAIGGVEAVVTGVEGVAMGVVGMAAVGVAEGVAIGVVGGVATEAAGEVPRGTTEYNSKSVTRIGIEGTGDSVDCGRAKLGEIPNAELRTKRGKNRMARVISLFRAGEENMRGSLGRGIPEYARLGRKVNEIARIALTCPTASPV
jgi:hypothetical protein